MMQKFVSIFLIMMMSFCVLISNADAKRFGGGRNFGAFRSQQSFSRMSQRPAATNWQQPRTNSASRWLAPLAGLAIGGLIGSLMMGNGMMNGVMSWILIAGGIMLLLRLLRQFMQPKMQPQSSPNVFHLPREEFSYNAFKTDASPKSPVNFNEDEFLRAAKVQFIRLQAAYDKKNLDDIRKFTTEEVFAEIKLQLQERGDQFNQTDVVTVDAKLLDIGQTEASVEFSGLIKEDPLKAAESFNEVWHFSRHAGEWVVAGVQQN